MRYNIKKKKKHWAIGGGGGAASDVDLGAEGDVRPQLHTITLYMY